MALRGLTVYEVREPDGSLAALFLRRNRAEAYAGRRGGWTVRPVGAASSALAAALATEENVLDVWHDDGGAVAE